LAFPLADIGTGLYEHTSYHGDVTFGFATPGFIQGDAHAVGMIEWHGGSLC
jgi:hypothetical protein